MAPPFPGKKINFDLAPRSGANAFAAKNLKFSAAQRHLAYATRNSKFSAAQRLLAFAGRNSNLTPRSGTSLSRQKINFELAPRSGANAFAAMSSKISAAQRRLAYSARNSNLSSAQRRLAFTARNSKFSAVQRRLSCGEEFEFKRRTASPRFRGKETNFEVAPRSGAPLFAAKICKATLY